MKLSLSIESNLSMKRKPNINFNVSLFLQKLFKEVCETIYEENCEPSPEKCETKNIQVRGKIIINSFPQLL